MVNRTDTGSDERPRLEDEEGQLPESDPNTHNEDDLEGELPEAEDEGAEDSEEDELEKAREHADPTRGDREVDGGDRVSTDEGGNPQE